jgi:hypothetical protein
MFVVNSKVKWFDVTNEFVFLMQHLLRATGHRERFRAHYGGALERAIMGSHDAVASRDPSDIVGETRTGSGCRGHANA